MPVFSNAQGLTINGGEFTDNSTNIMNGLSGIDVLREASCPEAAHDAESREYPPRCFPGTREQFIEDIVNWVVPTLGDAATPIYWMKGPAGVGKSAVAQTCAEELKDQNKLGAAFFFSISGCKTPGQFFPSIAYQLSTIHPPYRDLVNNRILNDMTLVKKTMSSQFRYLISEPLRELEAEGKGIGTRIAVIVDGLDECEGVDAQREIIHIIAGAASDEKLPLCWAFFSRQEPHIEAAFARPTITPYCHKVILPISCEADGEIELYLQNGFENILQRHNISMQSPWPSAEDMKILVDAASGSFIYATTVLRYVDHPGSLVPRDRLRAIINTILALRNRDPHAGPSTDAPFAQLDALYTLTLQRIPTEILPSVHLLLSLICRHGLLGAIQAANLLGMSKDEFEAVCNHTSAVVHLTEPGKEIELDSTIDTSCTYTQADPDVRVKVEKQVLYELGGQVYFYHKSFDDFLLDPARSGSYCAKASEALAKHYAKMHVAYDRSYSWEGSELVLASGVTDSGSTLSYPYTNELINSIIKTSVYIRFSSEDTESLSAVSVFGALSANCDFRKNLHMTSHLAGDVGTVPGSSLVWGCQCRDRAYLGTCISWMPLAKFDINAFKLMVKQCKQAKVIKRYHPNFSSWLKFLFRDKTQGRFESAVYRMGHGEKSIFWYWEIDYELGHYREFRTINLAEGEKRFRGQDFDTWPEWGHDLKS